MRLFTLQQTSTVGQRLEQFSTSSKEQLPIHSNASPKLSVFSQALNRTQCQPQKPTAAPFTPDKEIPSLLQTLTALNPHKKRKATATTRDSAFVSTYKHHSCCYYQSLEVYLWENLEGKEEIPLTSAAAAAEASSKAKDGEIKSRTKAVFPRNKVAAVPGRRSELCTHCTLEWCAFYRSDAPYLFLDHDPTPLLFLAPRVMKKAELAERFLGGISSARQQRYGAGASVPFFPLFYPSARAPGITMMLYARVTLLKAIDTK